MIWSSSATFPRPEMTCTGIAPRTPREGGGRAQRVDRARRREGARDQICGAPSPYADGGLLGLRRRLRRPLGGLLRLGGRRRRRRDPDEGLHRARQSVEGGGGQVVLEGERGIRGKPPALRLPVHLHQELRIRRAVGL